MRKLRLREVLFFLDRLGQTEREGGRNREGDKYGPAPIIISTQDYVAGATEWCPQPRGCGLGRLGDGPGTNSDPQRTVGILAINTEGSD